MYKDINSFLSQFKACYISNKGTKYYSRDFLVLTNFNPELALFIFKEIDGKELAEYITLLCEEGILQYNNTGYYEAQGSI